MKALSNLTLFLLIILTSSCHRIDQKSNTLFLDGTKFGISKVLNYRFNISDTISPLDIYITARFTADYRINTFPIVISYISPKGVKYCDSLVLNLKTDSDNPEVVVNGIWRDFRWLYRNGVTFNQKGQWLVCVKQNHIKDLVGIKEMGITLKSKK